jgi:O-antigen ligase
MPPSIALLAWFTLLVALLYVERDRTRHVSIALWLPVLWLFIAASRLPSQWVNFNVAETAGSLEEGNALDRAVYLALIAASIAVLASRSLAWKPFFAANVVLTAMLAFSVASVAWSDYPMISLKRWIRDIGVYLAVLVVLTDRSPSLATQEVVRRLTILLIPLSIVLVKYFPEIALHYGAWSGQKYYIGATTSKNMLGVLCLVCGLYLVWDLLAMWRLRHQRGVWRTLSIDLVLLTMTLWLLDKAGSATSALCLLVGAAVVLAAHFESVRRRPSALVGIILVAMGAHAILEVVFDVDLVAVVATAVGRNPDITGRTHIWSIVLAAGTNPIVGTGYEAFWLGPRLEWVWSRAGEINVAHNGYIEVYLTLGVIGLGIVVAFLLVALTHISRRFFRSPMHGSLALALWTVVIFYNITESALRGSLLWIVFLLFAIVVPARATTRSARALFRAPTVSRDARGRHSGKPAAADPAWSGRVTIAVSRRR